MFSLSEELKAKVVLVCRQHSHQVLLVLPVRILFSTIDVVCTR